jgi:hypothetical protein
MSSLAPDPQPVLDGRGATILGPRNVAIERQNPDVNLDDDISAGLPRTKPTIVA